MAKAAKANPPETVGRRRAGLPEPEGRRRAGGAEYRLLIIPQFDERRQLPTTLFLLETVQNFASFRYELSVKHGVSGKAISIQVLGLKAPQLSLPASGHASFEHQYDNLNGSYELTVKGIDGRVNMFSVKITSKKVQLLEAPTDKFVDVVVDEKLWQEIGQK